jgi:predicted permease
VLLAGAGLFVRSLRAALGADTGYDTRRVAVALVNTGLQRYDGTRSAAFYAALRERLAAHRGLSSVALAAWLPLTGEENVFSFRVPPTAGDTATRRVLAVNLVSPDYFRTVGVPLRAGREFTERDGRDAPTVAVVNETMARRYWPDGRAVGGRLQLGQVDVTVVGVARDAGYVELGEEPRPFVYLPLAQAPGDVMANQLAVLARGAGRPEAAVPVLREAVRALDRDVPVLEAGTYDGLLAQLLLPQRLAATLLGLFGGLTLVLASVGVYGVIAYAVGQRTREIGIRVALGASRRRVVADVLGRGAWLVAAGVAIGLGLALAAGRLVAAFLFGVGGSDPLALGASALVLGAVALVATYLPARRASRVDPALALRAE